MTNDLAIKNILKIMTQPKQITCETLWKYGMLYYKSDLILNKKTNIFLLNTFKFIYTKAIQLENMCSKRKIFIKFRELFTKMTIGTIKTTV